MAVRKQEPLSVVYPNAAGIDIGGHSHFVAVPPERCEHSVREFKSFTASLEDMAQWLKTCAVDTVVMESTGVYWIPVYEYLESCGFTVFLVNARHVKNVSGKKSDVLDCQWLRQLMSFGLLAGAFRPHEQVCALRALVRQRTLLVAEQASQTQRMRERDVIATQKFFIRTQNVLVEYAKPAVGFFFRACERAALHGGVAVNVVGQGLCVDHAVAQVARQAGVEPVQQLIDSSALLQISGIGF